jgi:class 3 adenylate cyclase
MLPKHVASELKTTGKSEPKRFESMTILFTDFKGFTELVASIPAITLVKELNGIFSRFDNIMAEEGVEKIQTVGDAYLAACGVPEKDPDHAYKCVKAAKRMIEFLESRNAQNEIQWKMRVGIHSGPIVAGVVGKKKLTYGLFGGTINTASRFETTSESGKINVSSSTYEKIKGRFDCEYRGKIMAKGKGELDMYFVK